MDNWPWDELTWLRQQVQELQAEVERLKRQTVTVDGQDYTIGG